MEALIARTYRCNARCHMYNIWENQTKKDIEVWSNEIK